MYNKIIEKSKNYIHHPENNKFLSYASFNFTEKLLLNSEITNQPTAKIQHFLSGWGKERLKNYD